MVTVSSCWNLKAGNRQGIICKSECDWHGLPLSLMVLVLVLVLVRDCSG